MSEKDKVISSAVESSPAYILDAELRTMCGYFNSTFYCVKGKLTEHSVQSYAQLLLELNAIKSVFDVTEISFSKLQELYSVGSEKKYQSYTQEDVLALIKKAAEQEASDMHIIVDDDNSTIIKHRILGDMLVVDDTKSDSYGMAILGSMYNTMTENGKPYFSTDGSADGRIKQEFIKDYGLFGLRYSQRKTDNGVFVVLRLFYNKGNVSQTLESLGYTEQQCADINRLINRRGMVIFSGATGSGKSTTIAVILRMIIKMTEGKRNIITIEDPPEFKIEGAVQTVLSHMPGYEDMDKAISAAWAEAMRSIMRLDPDIIMAGEIRDEQSATGAIRAARTGHQVWSTIHTTDALSVFDRLRDMGCDAPSIANPAVLSGLINQSLAKVLCSKCKLPLKGNEHLINDSSALSKVKRLTKWDGVYIKGAGCDACNHFGFTGRTAIAEIVVTDKKLMTLLRDKGGSAAFEYWISKGGVSKCAMLTKRVNEGVVDPFISERELHIALDDDEIMLGSDE